MVTLEVESTETLEARETGGGEGFLVGIGWFEVRSNRLRSSPKTTLLWMYGKPARTKPRNDGPLTRQN